MPDELKYSKLALLKIFILCSEAFHSVKVNVLTKSLCRTSQTLYSQIICEEGFLCYIKYNKSSCTVQCQTALSLEAPAPPRLPPPAAAGCAPALTSCTLILCADHTGPLCWQLPSPVTPSPQRATWLLPSASGLKSSLVRTPLAAQTKQVAHRSPAHLMTDSAVEPDS